MFQMVNYLTYKIIIGDQQGAFIYKKFLDFWYSAKTIDDTYMGPEFNWCFYQLGDFDQVNLSITKWELWSAWRIKNPEELDKGVFVGASAGLFFYNVDNEKSYEDMKQAFDVFLSKKKGNNVPLQICALYDPAKYSKEMVASSSFFEDQRTFVEINNGKIEFLDQTRLDSEPLMILSHIFIQFLQILRPDLCAELDIHQNFWLLPFNQLKAILNAYRKGIKIRPRHAPLKISTHEESIVYEQIIPSESVIEDQVAISPEGEKITIPKEISPTEIVELLKKGYKLPPGIVIPRHCPKCFNQNQKTIHEITDKSVILMDYPRIYGTRFDCGNCGNSWR
jgi:hypothetical protein